VANGTYEGEFFGGLRSGRGARVYGTGERYVGRWRLGKRHGEGTLTYRDGSRFEGTFVDGVRHGRGVFTSAKGLEFAGSFVSGKREGYGEAEMPDGGWYKVAPNHRMKKRSDVHSAAALPPPVQAPRRSHRGGCEWPRDSSLIATGRVL
jgi:hypothetical protein